MIVNHEKLKYLEPHEFIFVCRQDIAEAELQELREKYPLTRIAVTCEGHGYPDRVLATPFQHGDRLPPCTIWLEPKRDLQT